MKQINWGMIGCGDVTEKKSAPSFNKIEGSFLQAVYSRSKEKAAEYARRNNVPDVYDSAEALFSDPQINAIYIASPPSSHAEYAIQAMEAGKPVYVEKPMAATYAECLKMNRASEKTGMPLFVAYYRRSMDYFIKVRELLEENAIGRPYLCRSSHFMSPRATDLSPKTITWRVIPEISGGGYFHDMGCHELDILVFLFGEPLKVSGYAVNKAGLYIPEDTVIASLEFGNELLYSGSWCFVVPESSALDEIEIIGTRGSLKFSCFNFSAIELITEAGRQVYPIKAPEHVQFPMIKSVVKELQGTGESPSHGKSAALINRMMEEILNP